MGDLRDERCSGPWVKIIFQPSNNGSARQWQRPALSPRKGIIMNVARTFNNWRKYRQTVTELGRMSSRELRDLGIDRDNIRSVARAAVGR